MSDQNVSFQHMGMQYTAMIASPETCPICHYAMNVSVLQAAVTVGPDRVTTDRLQVLFRCPRSRCDRLFLGVYEGQQKLLSPA